MRINCVIITGVLLMPFSGVCPEFDCRAVIAEDNPGGVFTQEPKIVPSEARPSVLNRSSAPQAGQVEATPAAPSVPAGTFRVLPGFQIELLYTVPMETQGSWVSVTGDPQGRLIVSDERDKGLYRVTPPRIGTGESTRVEKLPIPLTGAQGLLHAFDSLYVSVNHDFDSGLYRVRDVNGRGEYATAEKLQEFEASGEHGPHGLRLSPDGKSIVVVCGNRTAPPKNLSASRLPSNWKEDLLLPRMWDAGGHAVGFLAPGGWIAQTDPDGKRWELISSGYRNAYDIAFNTDGELFCYDSDMEWDMGLPWYRPTRVVHATSGSEFGWRSGSGKWPEYYPDSLPPLFNVGPGSPVGLTFGYGARFPAPYQQALFILDWTFGTIHALHLRPSGGSYEATMEEFIGRAPLPLTDAVVGADGALYFLIGGRGTQSELYRVTYVGADSTKPAVTKTDPPLHGMRHQLERFHEPGHDKEVVVPFAYEQLGHADRHIRYAARLALEHLPASAWQERVLRDILPRRAIHGAIGLARQGTEELREPLLQRLLAIDWNQIMLDEQLDLLRTYGLICLRLGHPDESTTNALLRQLEPLFPSRDWRVNREVCSLLVYLGSPTIIERTLDLMERQDTSFDQTARADLLERNTRYGTNIRHMMGNQPHVQNIFYAFTLRNVQTGWTLQQRQQYALWIERAKGWSGGHSYQGFLENTRKEALANATPEELAAVDSAIQPYRVPVAELPKPKGPGREWNQTEVEQLVAQNSAQRSFADGKLAFAAARCVICHRIAGEGGSTGPDLSNLPGRFNYHDLTEAILTPNKVISDQYRATTITTLSGKLIVGRIVNAAEDQFQVSTDPENPSKVETIAKSDIESLQPSAMSLMPEGLLKSLNQDEVLDLFAYLMSRGNPADPRFVTTQ